MCYVKLCVRIFLRLWNYQKNKKQNRLFRVPVAFEEKSTSRQSRRGLHDKRKLTFDRSQKKNLFSLSLCETRSWKVLIKCCVEFIFGRDFSSVSELAEILAPQLSLICLVHTIERVRDPPLNSRQTMRFYLWLWTLFLQHWFSLLSLQRAPPHRTLSSQ